MTNGTIIVMIAYCKPHLQKFRSPEFCFELDYCTRCFHFIIYFAGADLGFVPLLPFVSQTPKRNSKVEQEDYRYEILSWFQSYFYIIGEIFLPRHVEHVPLDLENV